MKCLPPKPPPPPKEQPTRPTASCTSTSTSTSSISTSASTSASTSDDDDMLTPRAPPPQKKSSRDGPQRVVLVVLVVLMMMICLPPEPPPKKKSSRHGPQRVVLVVLVVLVLVVVMMMICLPPEPRPPPLGLTRALRLRCHHGQLLIIFTYASAPLWAPGCVGGAVVRGRSPPLLEAISSPMVLHVAYAERGKEHGILFIFSLFCEYIILEYVGIHVIYRVNTAEYGIHILVVAPQEYMNIYSTRRPVVALQ